MTRKMMIRRYGDWGLADPAAAAAPAGGSWPGVVDLGIGGGTAAVAAVVTRSVAPAGSFFARHPGLMAALAGALVSLAARQQFTGIVAAAIVGGTVELLQLVTDYRVAHPSKSEVSS